MRRVRDAGTGGFGAGGRRMSDQLTMFGAGATVSACGRYRYELTRRWDDSGPLLEWIMLNPSTADADADDPTIRRCIGFAKRWGYGAIVVRNLYALRATNPQVLLNYLGGLADLIPAIGPENFAYLNKIDADCTIAAWGAHAAGLEWHAAGLRIKRRNLFCLGANRGGSPKHPLYVPSSRTPTPWAPS